MNNKIWFTLGVVLAVIVLGTGVYLGSYKKSSLGSAPNGVQATIASSTNVSFVAATAKVAIATSSCTARIISTTNSAIMITFSDYNNTAPTGILGVWQAASTTVGYDSGIYGCGLVKIFSYTTAPVTITDVQ